MAAIAGRRLRAIAAILFYWIRMNVVQQLTCLTLSRPNGPAYSTGELLNTPLVAVAATSATASTQCSSDILCHIGDDYR